MAKAFKKGDAVTLIMNYDRKGTFQYTDAVVYSCGAKRMVLTDAATGKELGRNYLPQQGKGWSGEFVFPRVADPAAKALELAAEFLTEHRADLEHIRDHLCEGNPGYAAALQRQLDKLHKPRAVERVRG